MNNLSRLIPQAHAHRSDEWLEGYFDACDEMKVGTAMTAAAAQAKRIQARPLLTMPEREYYDGYLARINEGANPSPAVDLGPNNLLLAVIESLASVLIKAGWAVCGLLAKVYHFFDVRKGK